MTEQDTFDEESGLALHDVMEQAANQGVDFESMETGEVATFSAIAARDASVGSQQGNYCKKVQYIDMQTMGLEHILQSRIIFLMEV